MTFEGPRRPDIGGKERPDRYVRALLAELGRLPRRQRAVLTLRYYEGLTDAEIAEVLGCRPGTVRGYASRALATLRVEMEPRPRPEPGLVQEAAK